MDNKLHRESKIRPSMSLHPGNPWSLCLLLMIMIGGTVTLSLFLRTPHSTGELYGGGRSRSLETSAIVHYATSRVVPQQSLSEISVTLNVLKQISPCNFLVFGLGHDSLMWAALNPRGNTLFLEEDQTWIDRVMKDAPTLALKAQNVRYRNQLSQADQLLTHYESEPKCWPSNSFLRGNDDCRLALNMLSDEVYDTEWDMIMIDAPRGYFPEAPGRMAAIYSAAVMVRNRRRSGVTHVFLHDVERRVEKMYAEKFLCRKNLVKAVGRLWHFEIPPASGSANQFC